jgi:hypothetical protein
MLSIPLQGKINSLDPYLILIEVHATNPSLLKYLPSSVFWLKMTYFTDPTIKAVRFRVNNSPLLKLSFLKMNLSPVLSSPSI